MIIRNIVLAGLATIALGTAVASAQDAGGIELSPQVRNTPNAQEQVLSHVFGQLQQFQQLRQLSAAAATPGTAAAAAAAGGGTPDATTARQQSLSAAQQFTARRLAQQQLQLQQAALNAPPQPVTVVNAYDSPVAIGNNNIVRQQVANSTTIGGGTAQSSIGGKRASAQADSGSATQSASSSATSIGGNANATAINSTITGQGNQ
ncbi:MAG TPA: hypothetical protein VJ747_15100 [Stellaceae bacterium]|nr:hypothetical protein [Stellaceae bacterium]